MRIFESHADLKTALAADTFRFTPEHGPASFRCSQCGQLKPLNTDGNGGTGYSSGWSGQPEAFFCYQCCGENEARDLRETGKGTLYLTAKPGHAELTNWPGTLRIPVRHMRKGSHNIARTRYDVWFHFAGAEWHGVQYGEWTQTCHVKRIKG